MKEPRVKKGFIASLPIWFKAVFVKFWFAGAVFYFIGWGIFIQSFDQLDLTIALGLVLGLITDLAVNKILIFLESGKKEYRPFLFFYSQKFFSLPVNLIYGTVISFLISYTYHFINLLAIKVFGYPETQVFLGVEPILYGIFFASFDMAFVGLKKSIKNVIRKERT